MPKHKTTASDDAEFYKAYDDFNDSLVQALDAEAKKLGVSSKDMSSIYYLRTRSRWTQEKEDYLIKLAREGKPLPDTFSGDF